MSDKKTNVSLGCFANFVGCEELLQQCAELEQTVEELSCAIENHRAFKRLKVTQKED